jgi:phage tail-like protein
MTCIPADRRFRLLDALVGWDVADASGLEGFDDVSGVRLARIAAAALTPDVIGRAIPPPWLAPGCGRCDWYLVTQAPPISRLLALGACDDGWRPLNASLPLLDAVAVAVDRFRIALADRGADRVWIVTTEDGHIVGEASVEDPVAVAFTPDAELVVASLGKLLSFDLSGQPLPPRFPPVPDGDVDRIAFGADCALWLVMRAADGSLSLWRAPSGAGAFAQAGPENLIAAFPPVPLVRVSARGFCLDRGAGTGTARVRCWNWQGRAVDPARIRPDAATTHAFEPRGQLLTRALDSGVPRCRWHRLRIDADVPLNTALEISVSTSEAVAPPPQGGASPPPWNGFASGVPHPDDWQPVAAPATDMLIRQPAGRYLFVRMRLTGPGTATPVVRRLRLDLPRATSADLLPIVYREEPDSADFTERFVGLFDATLNELDATVTRAPALLDVAGVPDELLPWVGRILGMTVDPGLTPHRRRQLLKAAPGLFRRRGTRSALIEAIQLATGLDAVVEEPGLARAWGAVGGATAGAAIEPARLGKVRLFGRGDARLRLGASRLGRTRLRSYGDPDLDPHSAGAFRIAVGLPALDAATRGRIEQLVDDLVPGHVLTDITTGRADGFWLLPAAKLAVDTRLGQSAPPVLGDVGVRLNRTTVLPRRASRRGGFALGHAFGCGSC